MSKATRGGGERLKYIVVIREDRWRARVPKVHGPFRNWIEARRYIAHRYNGTPELRKREMFAVAPLRLEGGS